MQHTFSEFADRVGKVLSKGLFDLSNAELLGKDLENVLFVTGNESADMDSCVSAILCSYYYTMALEKGEAPKHDFHFNPSIVIPLINIPRADLILRPDITFVLKSSGYSLGSVAFLDDFAPKINKAAKTVVPSYFSTKAFVMLVDHNSLDGATKQLFTADRVVAVLDHHADDGVYPTANPRVIKLAGSCISLVTTYWIHQLHQTNKFTLTSKKDAVNFAILGLGPVMADTSGLKSKVEAEDTETYEFYSSILHEYKDDLPKDEKVEIEVKDDSDATASSDNPSTHLEETSLADVITHPKKYSKMLKSKKRDIAEFSAAELLRKDYKEWASDDSNAQGQNLKVAISTLPASLAQVFAKYPSAKSPRAAFTQDALARAQSRGVDVYLASGTYNNAQQVHCRDTFICATSDKYTDGDMKSLIKNLTQPLDLKAPEDKSQPIYDEDSNSYQFLQGNTAASRKQVAPLLRHFVQGIPLAQI